MLAEDGKTASSKLRWDGLFNIRNHKTSLVDLKKSMVSGKGISIVK